MADSLGDRHRMKFHLIGKVGAADYPAWIERHARKLGIECALAAPRPSQVTVDASGAQEMLDAFALACSLGPQSVCVDQLQIAERSSGSHPD